MAAAGHALLVSVLLRPEVPPVDAGLLPIVAAVATAEGLGPDARIVWPNDVLIDGRKVAGILCEMSADQERVQWAVAGIGVNVRSAPALDDARWEAGALSDAGAPPRRADLLVDLLGALGRRYAEWVEEGPRAILDAYAGRDALRGRQVVVSLAGEEVTGECAGTDALGRLRGADRPSGERLLGAGEVVRVGPARAGRFSPWRATGLLHRQRHLPHRRAPHRRGARRARPRAPLLRRGGAAGHQRLLGAGRVPVRAHPRLARLGVCGGTIQGHGCPA